MPAAGRVRPSVDPDIDRKARGKENETISHRFLNLAYSTALLINVLTFTCSLLSELELLNNLWTHVFSHFQVY